MRCQLDHNREHCPFHNSDCCYEIQLGPPLAIKFSGHKPIYGFQLIIKLISVSGEYQKLLGSPERSYVNGSLARACWLEVYVELHYSYSLASQTKLKAPSSRKLDALWGKGKTSADVAAMHMHGEAHALTSSREDRWPALPSSVLYSARARNNFVQSRRRFLSAPSRGAAALRACCAADFSSATSRSPSARRLAPFQAFATTAPPPLL